MPMSTTMHMWLTSILTLTRGLTFSRVEFDIDSKKTRVGGKMEKFFRIERTKSEPFDYVNKIKSILSEKEIMYSKAPF